MDNTQYDWQMPFDFPSGENWLPEPPASDRVLLLEQQLREEVERRMAGEARLVQLSEESQKDAAARETIYLEIGRLQALHKIYLRTIRRQHHELKSAKSTLLSPHEKRLLLNTIDHLNQTLAITRMPEKVSQQSVFEQFHRLVLDNQHLRAEVTQLRDDIEVLCAEPVPRQPRAKRVKRS